MGKGYHPSQLSPKAINHVIDTQQDTVRLSEAQVRRTQLAVAMKLIQNGEDWNRPDMKRRGVEIIAGLLFHVELGTLDATLISNRRDWFIGQVSERSNGSE